MLVSPDLGHSMYPVSESKSRPSVFLGTSLHSASRMMELNLALDSLK
jgi:hypothetical protein